MTEDERQALAEAIATASGLPMPRCATEVSHGESGDVVLCMGAWYAKLVDPTRKANAAELGREVGMLRWLEGRAPAARVRWAGDIAGRLAMVTRALEGRALHDLAPGDAERGAVAAIATLTALHAAPAAACPFDERLAVKLAEAERRVRASEVDLGDLEPEHLGLSADALWQVLSARRPPDEDLVVTHGDACWPNFILGSDGIAAMLDLGRGGVADRHQDLALFIRSGQHNFPDLPVRELVAAYYRGGEIDDAKLDFYRLLDEFF